MSNHTIGVHSLVGAVMLVSDSPTQTVTYELDLVQARLLRDELARAVTRASCAASVAWLDRIAQPGPPAAPHEQR